MANSDPKTPTVEIEQVSNGYFLTVRYPADGVDTAKQSKLVFSSLKELEQELRSVFGEPVFPVGLPAPADESQTACLDEMTQLHEEEYSQPEKEGEWEENDDLSDFFDESA